MPMTRTGMVQCRHCQNCRWTIVAGANVCSECGHEYGPPSASELIDRVSRLEEVTAPLAAVAETHAALAESTPEAGRLPIRAVWERASVEPDPDDQTIAARLQTVGPLLPGLFEIPIEDRHLENPAVADTIDQAVRGAVKAAVPRDLRRSQGFAVAVRRNAVRAGVMLLTAVVPTSDGKRLEQDFVSQVQAGKPRARVTPSGPSRLVSANGEALGKGVALNPIERLDEELRLSGEAHRTSSDLDSETEMGETGWQVQDSSPLMMWKLPVWAWPLMIVLAGPIDPIIRKFSSTKRSRR